MQSLVKIIELLIVHRGDIHVQADAPLRWAAEEGRLDIVKLLVERGADIHAREDEPLRVAKQKGHHEVAAFLRSKAGQEVKQFTIDVIKEIVEQAHMAGQINAGIDPSFSNAQQYCDRLFSAQHNATAPHSAQ